MTIETLKKRISGKYTAIDKLNKKIHRMNEAKASGWEKNPYYYNERDLMVALKELRSEQEALKKYEEQLQTEEEKATSRDVQVILDFLEEWKAKSIEWFKKEKARFTLAQKEYFAKEKEMTQRWKDSKRLGLTKEESVNLRKDIRELGKQFSSDWAHVTQFNHGSRSWEENLERDLEIEKNRKYDDLIERVNSIVGTITDASNLHVGYKGDLDGYIIGERGKAKVQTIGAGGYNIVRYHYRTLVHKID